MERRAFLISSLLLGGCATAFAGPASLPRTAPPLWAPAEPAPLADCLNGMSSMMSVRRLTLVASRSRVSRTTRLVAGVRRLDAMNT